MLRPAATYFAHPIGMGDLITPPAWPVADRAGESRPCPPFGFDSGVRMAV